MLTSDPKKLQKAGDTNPEMKKGILLKRRQENLNCNGWGFADSTFALQGGELTFTGSRYCNLVATS